jgi:hypothetical protein
MSKQATLIAAATIIGVVTSLSSAANAIPVQTTVAAIKASIHDGGGIQDSKYQYRWDTDSHGSRSYTYKSR